MKFLRSTSTTTRPLILILAICLATIHESLGATLLTRAVNEITVDSADSFGMPTSIIIGYESDFGTAVTSSTTDKAWLDWSITAGNTYYTGGPPPGSISSVTSTTFTIDLTRSGTDPSAIGDITVTLKVILNYNNDGVNDEMDEVDYTFTVNVAGGASSTTVDSSAATTAGGFSGSAVTEDSEGSGSVTSTAPTLTIQQSGGSVSFGSDIVLQATVTGGTATIWVDPTDPVIASDDAIFTDPEDYTWPAIVVGSSVTTETGTTTSVDITLESVPVRVFNWGDVYFQCTVHYRDISNDRRQRFLRERLNQSHHRQYRDEEKDTSQKVVAKVSFASDDSGTMTVSSFMIVSTTAMVAGAALLI